MTYFAGCGCGWLSPAVSLPRATTLGNRHAEMCHRIAWVQQVTDRDDHLPVVP